MTPFETLAVATPKSSIKEASRETANHCSANDPRKNESQDFSTIMTQAGTKETKEHGRSVKAHCEENVEGSEGDAEIDGLEMRAGDNELFVPMTPQVVVPQPAKARSEQTKLDEADIVVSRTKGPSGDSETDATVSVPRAIQQSGMVQQQVTATIKSEEADRAIVSNTEVKGPPQPVPQNESNAPARVPVMQDQVTAMIDDISTPEQWTRIASASPVHDIAKVIPGAGALGEKTATSISSGPVAQSLTSKGPDRSTEIAVPAVPATKTSNNSEARTVEASLDERSVSDPKDSIPMPKQAAQTDVERRFRSLLQNEKSETETVFSVPSQKDADLGLGRSSTASSASAPRENSSGLARQAATQLAAAVQHRPDGVTEVALNPQELGRVQMTLRAHENSVTMVIVAERIETGEMMRRHVDQLAQEFRAMGFTSVSFEFGGQSARQGQERAQTKVKPVVGDLTTEQVHTMRPVSIASYHHGSLDLRV